MAYYGPPSTIPAPGTSSGQTKAIANPPANPGSWLQPSGTSSPAPAPAPVPTSTPAPTTTFPDEGLPGNNQPVSDNSNSSSIPTDNAPATGNTTTAPLPINPVTTPNEQIGNPSDPTSLSFAQVENYWIQAGGSPQAASMAAAVADAESGLNAKATRTNPDGSKGIGLWLIPENGTPPGSTDPIANARAAVQLSQGGTDWTQWCSAWSDNNCGQNNGTYLGQGANALMSLATQKPGASYNVFGSTAAGNGISAGAATGAGGVSTPATPKSKLPILIVGLVIVVIVVFVLVNRKKQGKDSQVQTQVQV